MAATETGRVNYAPRFGKTRRGLLPLTEAILNVLEPKRLSPADTPRESLFLPTHSARVYSYSIKGSFVNKTRDQCVAK